jgi:hypothetical protein
MASLTSWFCKSPTRSTSCQLFLVGHESTDLQLRPGGYLDPTETDEDGIITRLNEQLGVPLDVPGQNLYEVPDGGDWQVAECLSTWWRPNFDTFLVSGLCAETSSSQLIMDAVPLSACTRDRAEGVQEAVFGRPSTEE